MTKSFALWCAPCMAKEHLKGSPDVKCWSGCENCGTVTNLYLVNRIDPLDNRVHTARIDAAAATVLIYRRNGRKTKLVGTEHCERWVAAAYDKGVATRIDGEVLVASFDGDIFEPLQNLDGG